MIWFIGLITSLMILAADFSVAQPVDHAVLHLLVGLTCLMLAPAFAVFQSLVTTRRWASLASNGSDSPFIEGHFDSKQRVPDVPEVPGKAYATRFVLKSLLVSNMLVWVFGCISLLSLAKWPQLVRQNWKLESIPLLDEIVMAIPMLASVFLSWLVICEAERMLRDGSCRSRSSLRQRLILTWQRIRTFSGLVLVPIGALFLARDLLHLLFPTGIGNLAMCGCCILFLLFLLTIYPVILARTWQTHSVQDVDLETALRKAARESGLPNERFSVWETNGTIANAVVAGVIPRLRRIFFSDLILEHFENEEIVAIFRHELGHIVHRHLIMRITLVVVPLLILATLTWQVASVSHYTLMDALGFPPWFIAFVMSPVLYLAYAVFVVGRFVKKSEIQADMYAIRKRDGSVCRHQAEAYSLALIKMAALSPEMLHRSTLAHPSIRARLEVIRQVVDQPALAQRYDQRFHVEQWLTAAAMLVGTLICVV